MAQKKYVVGKQYRVKGPSGKSRVLVYVGNIMIGGLKHEFFRRRTKEEVRMAKLAGEVV